MILPIPGSTPSSVNHRLPSGPAVMSPGALASVSRRELGDARRRRDGGARGQREDRHERSERGERTRETLRDTGYLSAALRRGLTKLAACRSPCYRAGHGWRRRP